MWRQAIMVIVLGAGVGAAIADDKDGRVTIRAMHKEGQLLQYGLRLSGAVAWTPSLRDVQWGRMSTDFTFTLRGKALRERGACTYELIGQRLHSSGENDKGKFELLATPEKYSFQTKNRVELNLKNSPLAKPMTMTFGPQWGYRFGTGLLPVAVYMLPGANQTFFRALATAPLKPVKPGDTWSTEFDLAVPGGKGRPLKVKGQWKVLDWEKMGGRKVLAITAAADLKLTDSNLMLRNGDTIHIASGTYAGRGKVFWDVEGGRLAGVSVDEKLLVKADKPEARALRSEAKVELKLLRYQAPAGN